MSSEETDWGQVTFDRAHELGVSGQWCWCYDPESHTAYPVTMEDVADAAAEIFPPDGVAKFMTHPQHRGALGGLTPSELVAAGRGREVLALIESLADGVVF